MKFLVDENLPPALAKWVSARGHDAVHASNRSLLGATDLAIARAAQAEQRVIITRDNDFDRLIEDGGAARVLRLTLGNCRTADLLDWLEPRFNAALEMLSAHHLVILD